MSTVNAVKLQEPELSDFKLDNGDEFDYDWNAYRKAKRSHAARLANITRQQNRAEERRLAQEQRERRQALHDALTEEAQSEISDALCLGKLDHELESWFEKKVSDAMGNLRSLLREGTDPAVVLAAAEHGDHGWQSDHATWMEIDYASLLEEVLLEEEFCDKDTYVGAGEVPPQAEEVIDETHFSEQGEHYGRVIDNGDGRLWCTVCDNPVARQTGMGKFVATDGQGNERVATIPCAAN